MPPRALVWLSLLLATQVSAQVPVEQCSTENTSPEGAHFSLFQSHGLCTQTCGGYAFGVLQYQNCWCSNYAPSTSGASCTRQCPGYPKEFCGSDNGAFTYLALGPDPHGTGIGGGGGPTSSQAVIDTPVPSSESPQAPAPSTPPIFPAIPVGPDPDPTSAAEPSIVTAKPVTSISIITVSGSVQTEVVTQTPAPTPSYVSSPDTQPLPSPQKHGLSNGAVAGIAIGVVLGLGFIAGIIFLVWRRKRGPNGRDAEGNMRRNPSVLSKVGLLRGDSGHGDVPFPAPAARRGFLPKIRTHGLGLGSDTGSAVTAETQMSEARRSSRPLFVDNRLNPNALMLHANASRTSVGTLQDDKDYTRPLAVRNPD